MLRRLLLAAFLALAGTQAEAAARFLVACTTACTWDGSSTAIWSTTSGGAPGSSVPGSSDTVTLDANTCVGGVTCTVTVNTTVTVQTITFGACTASTTGCVLDFSANNNNVTLSGANTALSGTGTGVRTLNMGNGLWDFTGAQPALDFTTVTSFTFNANSSTVRWSGASQAGIRQFITGGKTFSTVTINASNGYGVNISGASTIATLNITGQNHVVFPASTTTTITTLNVTGTSSQPVLLNSSSAGSTGTVAVTNATMSGVALNQLIFTGSPTATTCYDVGSNSGITCTAPAGGGGSLIGGGFK